eukprot:CAMPEP_0185017566 /NCGR_PEP_ID=MMETSP1103-20130426/504_1 /TAXON_ID=36769 /ORGANISM="Paraphysomonas bandaiensis, Strain Caron Lab Isolate" /LENGTH=194 /DNA_ID=CAMNT_0027547033 /DNA_START=76 /DNA_END=657 /DNA_ORIENTATION=-
MKRSCQSMLDEEAVESSTTVPKFKCFNRLCDEEDSELCWPTASMYEGSSFIPDKKVRRAMSFTDSVVSGSTDYESELELGEESQGFAPVQDLSETLGDIAYVQQVASFISSVLVKSLPSTAISFTDIRAFVEANMSVHRPSPHTPSNFHVIDESCTSYSKKCSTDTNQMDCVADELLLEGLDCFCPGDISDVIW